MWTIIDMVNKTTFLLNTFLGGCRQFIESHVLISIRLEKLRDGIVDCPNGFDADFGNRSMFYSCIRRITYSDDKQIIIASTSYFQRLLVRNVTLDSSFVMIQFASLSINNATGQQIAWMARMRGLTCVRITRRSIRQVIVFSTI